MKRLVDEANTGNSTAQKSVVEILTVLIEGGLVAPPDPSTAQDPIVHLGLTKTHRSSLVDALLQLRVRHDDVLDLFSSTAAGLLGVPDFGAYPPDERNSIVEKVVHLMRSETYLAGMIEFARKNRLELALERIHQFATVVATMHVVYLRALDVEHHQ